MEHPAVETTAPSKRLNYFERYLTAWVGLCDRPVRAWVGSRAGDGGRRTDRGSGDAVGMFVLQPDAALVSCHGSRRLREQYNDEEEAAGAVHR